MPLRHEFQQLRREARPWLGIALQVQSVAVEDLEDVAVKECRLFAHSLELESEVCLHEDLGGSASRRSFFCAEVKSRREKLSALV